MARKSPNLDSTFNLRHFQDDDYEGLAVLRNLLYPQHPISVESMRHNDKAREEKILHQQWVWAHKHLILCTALFTQWEEIYHPQKFVIKIYVHPNYQGSGYGTICYDHLMNELKQFDPIKITTQVYEPLQQSVRFFEQRGFNNSITERESSLDLTTYNPAEYEAEINRALQQGFRIITLSELRKEDEKADYKVWELEREVCPDMPWTDPITVPDYDTYSKQVLRHPKFNPNSWFFVMDGDRITGLNNLWKSELQDGIITGLTGVRRKYRRMGVATALKHTSLTWSKNQGYKWIRTDNAATNEGMLSINIKVGFKFMPAWLVFDKIIKEEE